MEPESSQGRGRHRSGAFRWVLNKVTAERVIEPVSSLERLPHVAKMSANEAPTSFHAFTIRGQFPFAGPLGRGHVPAGISALTKDFGTRLAVLGVELLALLRARLARVGTGLGEV